MRRKPIPKIIVSAGTPIYYGTNGQYTAHLKDGTKVPLTRAEYEHSERALQKIAEIYGPQIGRLDHLFEHFGKTATFTNGKGQKVTGKVIGADPRPKGEKSGEWLVIQPSDLTLPAVY